MNNRQLFEMIGYADDRFVAEADRIKATGTNGGKKKITAILIAAALVILLAVGGTAAYRLSLPSDLDLYLEKTEIKNVADLSDPEKGGITVADKTQESAGYAVTFEALVSGPRMYERREGRGPDEIVTLSRGEDDLYALFTLRRTDGGGIDPEMPLDLHFVICEKGYMPFEGAFENFRTYSIENNVVYFACMVTNAQAFADRTLYIAVSDHMPDGTVLRMDENGNPYFLESYTGIGVIFDLPLDKEKADPAAAAKLREYRAFNPHPDYSYADEIMRLDAEFEKSGCDLSGVIGENKWRGSYPLKFGEIEYSREFLSHRDKWKKDGIKTLSADAANAYLYRGEPLPEDVSSFTLPDATVCRYMRGNVFFCLQSDGTAFSVTVPSEHMALKFTESINCVNMFSEVLGRSESTILPDLDYTVCYLDGIDPKDTDYDTDVFTEEDVMRYYNAVTGDFTCVQDAVYRLALYYSGYEGTVEYVP